MKILRKLLRRDMIGLYFEQIKAPQLGRSARVPRSDVDFEEIDTPWPLRLGSDPFACEALALALVP